MARKIVVDPTVLETTSKQIDDQANDYETNYKKLFNDVDGMGHAWQGSDNTAFVTQIQGFMDDFQQITALMRKYAQFLRDSATTYRNTQNDVITNAKSLAN